MQLIRLISRFWRKKTMEAAVNLTRINSSEKTSYSFDTTFVLFFLAVDFGQNLGVLAFDTIFLGVTLIAVSIAPYLLNNDEKLEFGNWILGRGLIVLFAILLGLMFKQALGVVLPETFRYLPFTFLIITAMVTCYLQFSNFFRFHLSK